MVAAANPCPEGSESWGSGGGGWKFIPLAEGAGEEGVEVGRVVDSLLEQTIAPCSAVPLSVVGRSIWGPGLQAGG